MIIHRPVSDVSTAVLIFSKPPIEGRVKTRLANDVGDALAVHVYQSVVRRIVNELSKLKSSVDLYLSVADGQDHPFFTGLQQQYSLGVHCQSEGNLGAKMLSALNELLETYSEVIIVGGDAVSISCGVIEQCRARLAAQDVVIVPSEDGGYVLIGGKTTHEKMFDRIEWGTDVVLFQQLERLNELKLSSYVAEKLWDLDDLRDLVRTLDDSMLTSELIDAGLDLKRVRSIMKEG